MQVKMIEINKAVCVKLKLTSYNSINYTVPIKIVPKKLVRPEIYAGAVVDALACSVALERI